jgi:hypothetical protein
MFDADDLSPAGSSVGYHGRQIALALSLHDGRA